MKREIQIFICLLIIAFAFAPQNQRLLQNQKVFYQRFLQENETNQTNATDANQTNVTNVTDNQTNATNVTNGTDTNVTDNQTNATNATNGTDTNVTDSNQTNVTNGTDTNVTDSNQTNVTNATNGTDTNVTDSNLTNVTNATNITDINATNATNETDTFEERVIGFFAGWNSLLQIFEDENFTQIYNNIDYISLYNLLDELNEIVFNITFWYRDNLSDLVNSTNSTDYVFVIALRSYSLYKNYQDYFFNYDNLTSSEQQDFLDVFDLAMKEYQDEFTSDPDILLFIVKLEELLIRKPAQKALFDEINATLTIQEQLVLLRQIINYDVDAEIINTYSLDSDLMTQCFNVLDNLLDQEIESIDQLEELIDFQNIFIHIQMIDFTFGVFSLSNQTYDEFILAAKENLRLFIKSITQYSKFINITFESEQYFSSVQGIFVKVFNNNSIEEAGEEDYVDLGWTEYDDWGRKLGCKFPKTELQKLFDENLNLTNITIISGAITILELESYIGGLQTDAFDIQLLDQDGNPINVTNITQPILIQIFINNSYNASSNDTNNYTNQTIVDQDADTNASDIDTSNETNITDTNQSNEINTTDIDSSNASNTSNETNATVPECFYLNQSNNYTPVAFDQVNCSFYTNSSTNESYYEIQTTHLTTFGVKLPNVDPLDFRPDDYIDIADQNISNQTNQTGNFTSNDLTEFSVRLALLPIFLLIIGLAFII